MTKKLSVKNHLKNHLLWIAVLVAVFIGACSSENEVTTPVNPDTIPPALTNISASPNWEQNIPGKIVFYFSEDVNGFTTNDIKLSDVTVDKGELIPNSKKMYYWEITPRESGELYLNILAGSFEDLAGNFNTNNISTNFTVEEDSTPPVLTIPNDPPLMKGALGSMVFSFSEDVTNFTKNDIELSGLDVEEGEFITNSLSEYKLEVTPAKLGTVRVKVKGSSAHDLAGKPLAPFSTNLSVLPLGGKYSLEDVVELGEIPSDRSIFKGVAKDVLSYYTGTPEVVVRYVKKDGGGDGSSWTNATNDVKATINGISDASDSKIYLILVASGDYPSDSIAMKNNVAIIGGWEGADGWKRSGETLFNGQTKNQVFINSSIDGTAVLYGATITNGKTDQNSTFISGAGMRNGGASPTLIKVVFSGNVAGNITPGSIGAGNGGGMHNSGSSPTLVDVSFLNNTAKIDGGGMTAYHGSSPKLSNVVFSGNKVNNQGGGMHVTETKSKPELYNVSFLNNTAGADGGGIAATSGTLILENVSFSGNRATGKGGGVHNDNVGLDAVNVSFYSNTAQNGGGVHSSSANSYIYNASFLGNTADQNGGGVYYQAGRDKNFFNLLINSLFWGNQASDQINQIYYDNIGTGTAYTNRVMIFNSIVEGGSNSGGGVTLSVDTGASPIEYITANSIDDDPLLEALSDNGGFFHTSALKPNSPAIDKGVFLKRKVIRGPFAYKPTVYYSEDRRNWYVAFDFNDVLSLYKKATPPNDAKDLTATDARGYKRKGRPDIGAYEYGGTPPSTD